MWGQSHRIEIADFERKDCAKSEKPRSFVEACPESFDKLMIDFVEACPERNEVESKEEDQDDILI